ncbi:dolichol kinase-like [Ornithodoros turicata]
MFLTSMKPSRQRVLLEYLVVASGVFLSGFFAGLPSQYATAGATLVILVILYARQHDEQFKTDQRPHADSGLWLAVLLPFALLTGGNCYSHGEAYIVSEVVCSQTLLVSVSLLYDASWIVPFISVLWGAGLLIYTTEFVYFAVIISVFAVLIFQHISSSVKLYSPKSFTVGELVLVCQGVTTFLSCAVSALACKAIYGDECSLNSSASAGFLQAGLTSLCLFIAAIQQFPRLRTPLGFYVALLVSGACLVYPLCTMMVNHEPVSWLLMHCFDTTTRLCLMISWLLLTLAAIAFVSYYTTYYTKSSTVVRKVFHVVVVLVFIPGAVLDPDLMYLACGSILGVFMLLESVRTLRIPPFGARIHDAFGMFLDEKDCGAFVLTPVYLFIGCATPLLLFPGKFESKEVAMVLTSGTISLGIGDTVASVVGSRIGRHKWPGTVKSIEGTTASILAQFLVYYVLLWAFQVGVLKIGTLLLLSVLCLNAYLEALTTQVDNLALPVFVYPLMVTLYAGRKL